jgi:hypothetical protein
LFGKGGFEFVDFLTHKMARSILSDLKEVECFEWERHLAAIIVAGSHSHQKPTLVRRRLVARVPIRPLRGKIFALFECRSHI